MKVVIPGGSGQVGTILARDFASRGDEVVVLSRGANNRSAPWKVLAWDAETLADWQEQIDGADVVINLAGRSVNCRYNPENRRLIKESRTKSTAVVGEAIARAKKPPIVWLQMSTATIYAHRYDAPNDEETGIMGGSEPNAPDTWVFSIDVATSWERALDDAKVPECTRKVKLRTAMVMSPDRDGVFDVLLSLVRRGIGGTCGDGKQYVSWITDTDYTRAIRFIIESDSMDGAINLASPNPVPNAEFMGELRRAWGMPFGVPAPAWLLEIAAIPMQTETELILKSRRVIPGRLLNAGFTFDHPTWNDAAKNLCTRWRSQQ